MKFKQIAERVVLVEDLQVPAPQFGEAVRRKFGEVLEDVVPAKGSVGLYFKSAILFNETSDVAAWSRLDFSSEAYKAKIWNVPICYSLGPDLEEVCDFLSLDTQEFVKIHSSRTVTCFAVGFCPGFAYCDGLDSRLIGVPRRPSPRARVEPGMVGITGEMTAIYPLERPGGWRLIGKTPLVVCDPNIGFYPIQPGDHLRFRPIDSQEFEVLKGGRLGEVD